MRNLSGASGLLSGKKRTVDEWKAALMTLPDNKFFELFRSVFGYIKTPFNKQRLLDDLFVLLSRNEIRRIIGAYINRQDHKIIAAVALLNEPAPGELESFFAGEYSCAELHALVINLEERLILYRFRDDRLPRLALNPVLETVLAPFVADFEVLFPSFEPQSRFAEEGVFPGGNVLSVKSGLPECPAGTGRVNDGRTMAALFAFVQDWEDILKTEGGLRKKVVDEGKKIFPEMDLDLAIGVLLLLGLFRCEDRRLVPVRGKISAFTELSGAERQGYWAAGVCFYLDGQVAHNETGSRLLRNRLRETAAFIHRYRNLLEAGRLYPENTLRRIFELLGRDGNGRASGEAGTIWERPLFDAGFRGDDSAAGSGGDGFSFETFFGALEKAGLLERDGAFWKTPGEPSGEERDRPVIVMDTVFSFILYPEISFADALALAVFCSVKEISGAAVSFELTRSSAVRGFDAGMDAAAMLALLDRLSGSRLDANLGWTLREWERRYAGVSLCQGIVLSLAEDRRYLANAEPLASLIRQTLTPGVYLLSVEDRGEATNALRKAGVDIIAQPSSPAEDALPRGSFPALGPGKSGGVFRAFSFIAGRREAVPENPAEFPAENEDPGESGEAEAILENFRRILDGMGLPRAERDELSARIERRLVLSETQLEETTLRFEKLEARGLDYAGKAIIAKQAVETGSLLEVFWPGSEGIPGRTVGIPRALEKKGGESVLVLNADDAVEHPGDTIRIQGNTIRIPLGKISLLRRIKQSIFEE